MDVKVKPKVNLLGKAVMLADTGIATELYTLVPATIAIRKKQYII